MNVTKIKCAGCGKEQEYIVPNTAAMHIFFLCEDCPWLRERRSIAREGTIAGAIARETEGHELFRIIANWVND